MLLRELFAVTWFASVETPETETGTTEARSSEFVKGPSTVREPPLSVTARLVFCTLTFCVEGKVTWIFSKADKLVAPNSTVPSTVREPPLSVTATVPSTKWCGVCTPAVSVVFNIWGKAEESNTERLSAILEHQWDVLRVSGFREIKGKQGNLRRKGDGITKGDDFPYVESSLRYKKMKCSTHVLTMEITLPFPLYCKESEPTETLFFKYDKEITLPAPS